MKRARPASPTPAPGPAGARLTEAVDAAAAVASAAAAPAETAAGGPPETDADSTGTLAGSKRRAAVSDLLSSSSSYKVRRYDDAASGESKSVLFHSSSRGSVGKLIVDQQRGSRRAHVKSIFVKGGFRGKAFAHLLFLSAMRALRRRGAADDVDLEAEEDAGRHGRLVKLYERWGFHDRPGAKVQIIYNDEEAFRKVPMTRALPEGPEAAEAAEAMLVDSVAADGAEEALVVLRLEVDGGLFLVTPSSGAGASVSPAAASTLTLAADESGEHLLLVSSQGSELGVDAEGRLVPVSGRGAAWSVEELSGGLFALRLSDGRFLGRDPETWQAVAAAEPTPLSLRAGELHTTGTVDEAGVADSSPRSGHYRLMHALQTMDFAAFMRKRHQEGHLWRCGVWEALERVPAVTDFEGKPLPVLADAVRRAEALRAAGHPDWLQLTELLLALASLPCLGGSGREGLGREAHNMWALAGDSFVVGDCAPHAGLDRLLMSFTGHEYLYLRLRDPANDCQLPPEALNIVRFRHCPQLAGEGLDAAMTPDELGAKDIVAHAMETLSAADAPARASEEREMVDVAAARPYYQALIEKYCPGEWEF